MKKALIIFFFPVLTLGYTGTVQKIKGTRAIVEFERNAKIREGDMVYSEEQTESPRSRKFQNRDYSISYLLTYYSDNQSGTTSSLMSTSVQFGFSFQKFEIGPVLGFSTTSSAQGTTTNSTLFGVFGQYNFIANKANTDWVFFAGGKYSSSSASGSSSAGTYIEGFGGLNWFPIGNNVSFNFQIGYGQLTSSGSQATRLNFSSGPIIYF